ncbi:hypothetical protein, partial [Yersinia ruckeri]|uniref:hypothetical protein n=1 Tax=Yersinia ruckeri TaxID=29486 RepID=UPI0011A1E9AC
MSEITKRTDKGEIIIGQINDSRLTPNMPRVRSGRSQLFGLRIAKGGKPIQECDFSIEPPEKHIYALEVNGIWMWVNGCGHCNQNGEKMSYQVCDEHDRCQSCGIQRKDAIGIPRGSAEDGVWGWTCHPCKESQNAEKKAAALSRIPDDKDFFADEFECCYEAKCPYCSAEIETDNRHDANGELLKCNECGHSFKLTANYEVTWTTERHDG